MIPQIENVTFSKELSRRILITLGLLIVYRLGIHVPVPGINTGAIADFFASLKIHYLAYLTCLQVAGSVNSQYLLWE